MSEPVRGLTRRQTLAKRVFDLVVGGVLLVLSLPLTVLGWVAATVETRANGLFRQERIGREGKPFTVMKLRTMRVQVGTYVTVSGDGRITRSGRLMRKLKVDELPQLVNVLLGQMSLVGPRPDVAGFADELTGEDRIVLSVRPGITGPASLAYRHEEELLTAAPDPEAYNREVIWPDKVRLNRDYVENWSFTTDLRCLLRTVTSVFASSDPEKETVRG